MKYVGGPPRPVPGPSSAQKIRPNLPNETVIGRTFSIQNNRVFLAWPEPGPGHEMLSRGVFARAAHGLGYARGLQLSVFVALAREVAWLRGAKNALSAWLSRNTKNPHFF
jgi:hypothetical protein